MVHSHFWNLGSSLLGHETACCDKIAFIKACPRLCPYTHTLPLSDVYITIMLSPFHISQENILSIVTHYGLDGPGIKS